MNKMSVDIIVKQVSGKNVHILAVSETARHILSRTGILEAPSLKDGRPVYLFPDSTEEEVGTFLHKLYKFKWITQHDWDRRNVWQERKPTGEISQGPAPTITVTPQTAQYIAEGYSGIGDRYKKFTRTGAANFDSIPPGTTVWISPLAGLCMPNPMRIAFKANATPTTYVVTELEHKPIEKHLWAEEKYVFTNEAEFNAHLRAVGFEKKEYYHHFIDEQYQGTVYGIFKGDVLQLSLSMCSPTDTFSKKKGRELAKRRFELCGPILQTRNFSGHGEPIPNGVFFRIYAENLPSLFHSYNLPTIKNVNQKENKSQG